MGTEMIIVFLGIVLFLLAGTFGGIGIYFFLSNRSKTTATTLLCIGILFIVVYILSLLILL
ncbi:hypothetical protein QA612_21500 [Evansella sp. AB-P1]|uniref:hypothetical protein n=1 Tax=Evansella sp. AB-P1 TaxID=3037653 RepID=UPI00241C8D8C|nr:hypothetical protein [Evansella sp. AB-P1]MDG5790034.1 hypothetical protein [Evansella sp. AB-P1]